ncbi:hypothetical protein C8F04DRAFT_26202 [Mycena alexandri]|uniref:Transmembrane protein n=1 Tax=Mycena alexandri TaxID=1745969 RepID=A0AAD6TQ36_9AGAR|nr:hypothetical protein C8F04DRAFT_26202 [Mycena alexandri]
MVYPVVVVRLSIVVAALLFLLAFLHSGLNTYSEESSTSNDLDVASESLPDLSTAASVIVQTLLDDPAYFDHLVSAMDTYDAQSAYRQRRRLRRADLHLAGSAHVKPFVVEALVARTTSFVAANMRSRLGWYLAAYAGPPTATSPLLSDDEYDVLNVPASVITAALPGSRLALPSPPTTLTALVVALSLLAVSLLVSAAHLRRLARITEASSPSPSPSPVPIVSPHTPAAPKPVALTGKACRRRGLLPAKKFVPWLTPIPEALLSFDNVIILKSPEALARQQKDAMRQMNAPLVEAAASPAPQTPAVAPPTPVVSTIADPLATIASVALHTAAPIVSVSLVEAAASPALQTPNIAPPAPVVVATTAHAHAPPVSIISEPSQTHDEIIYQTPVARPNTALASDLPGAIIYQTGPRTIIRETPTVAVSRDAFIIYQTPTPVSASPAVIYSTKSRPQSTREPSVFYQTPVPAPSSSLVSSISGPINGPFRSYQNPAPRPSRAPPAVCHLRSTKHIPLVTVDRDSRDTLWRRVYQTPTPVSASPAVIYPTKNRPQSTREPSVFYQTPVPAPSSSLVSSASGPINGAFRSYQNSAPRPSRAPSAVYHLRSTKHIPLATVDRDSRDTLWRREGGRLIRDGEGQGQGRR